MLLRPRKRTICLKNTDIGSVTIRNTLCFRFNNRRCYDVYTEGSTAESSFDKLTYSFSFLLLPRRKQHEHKGYSFAPAACIRNTNLSPFTDKVMETLHS
jgi:hypothetical protein